MKMVTYNPIGVRARLPRLIEYLDEKKPDALCLQEIKCDDDSFPINAAFVAAYEQSPDQGGADGLETPAPSASAS